MNAIIEQKFRTWYPPYDLVSPVGTGVVFGGVLIGSDHLYQKICRCSHPIANTVATLIAQKRWFGLGTQGTYVSILGPFAEEVLIRGIVYDLQKESYSMNKVENIVGNAALFTAMHLTDYNKARVWSALKTAPNTFFAGLVFCTLTEITGNLWASTIAHMINNTAYFALVSRAARKSLFSR